VTEAERRRRAPQSRSPIDILTQMPALVVLDRMPVPVLAVDEDGLIVYANRSFEDMVGEAPAHMTGRPFRDLLRRPIDGPVSGADLAARAGTIVELGHVDGWTVYAKMSESVLLRDSDAGYLVAFEDVTERSWERQFAD
jgi:PAS domain S-box-containing protein